MIKLVTFLRILICSFLLALTSPLFAQGTQVAFGTAAQDTTAPIEVSADELTVNQKTSTAIFIGDVLIIQGEMRLGAAKVEVIYREETQGISRLEATGSVTLVSGADAEESDYADYKVDDGTIEMTGNVLLTQDQSSLTADRMTVDLDAGTARMQGQVKTILQPKEN